MIYLKKGTLINFTTGYYGNAYNKGVNYTVDGRQITGYIEEKFDGVALNEREGLTVRIELPNGYFVGARKHVDVTPAVLVIAILSLPYVVNASQESQNKEAEVASTEKVSKKERKSKKTTSENGENKVKEESLTDEEKEALKNEKKTKTRQNKDKKTEKNASENNTSSNENAQ